MIKELCNNIYLGKGDVKHGLVCRYRVLERVENVGLSFVAVQLDAESPRIDGIDDGGQWNLEVATRDVRNHVVLHRRDDCGSGVVGHCCLVPSGLGSGDVVVDGRV